MYEFKTHEFTPRATLYSDSEQFIYNWMLEDDLDLDWGNWKEPNRREEKRITLTVVLDQGQQKRLRRQRALLCKSSCDLDSRKLTLTVVLDQGLAKKAQETKGIVMQTKSWCGFMQINPGSHVGSRSSKEDTGNNGKKGIVMQTGQIYKETGFWAAKKE